MDIVFDRFKQLIEEKNLLIDEIDDDGLIHIKKDDWKVKISLDNVRRQYNQDNDISCVDDFVEVMISGLGPLPEWKMAKERIYFSLFPNDFEFDGVINYPITNKVNTIFIYSFNLKNSWISEEQVSEWGITQKELVEAANINMNKLLANTQIKNENIEGKSLLFFETDKASLKSALLISKELKAKVEKLIGWPVFAVFPVRDFCYLFSEEDFDFFAARLGSTVVQEYKESGYPLSTEVIKISDEGIRAIGEYPLE
jgi:uncharacterized protein YtpQ (UPF0354 family)